MQGVSLEHVAHKLAAVGSVTKNPFLVRATIDSFVVTVFPDGRAGSSVGPRYSHGPRSVREVHRKLTALWVRRG